MTAGVKINKKLLADALRKTHGNMQLSAQMLKATREGVRKCIERHPDLQAIVHEERDGVIDVAEGALQRAVLNGEAWAVSFTLKTIGKTRGYVERVEQEITGKDGGPLEVTHDISPETAAVLKQLYREGKV